MERLTQKNWRPHDIVILDYASAAKICNRLAEYEDTGLTPEEVKSLQSECEFWHLEAVKMKAELGEAKIAEAEGKIIRLPVPEGTPIWYIRYCTAPSCMNCWGYSNLDDCYSSYKARIMRGKFSTLFLDQFGKTVFLTREEAEAALKGSGKP